MLSYFNYENLKFKGLIYEQNVPLAAVGEDESICCGRLTAYVKAFNAQEGLSIEYGFSDDDDYEQFRIFRFDNPEEQKRVFEEIVRITKDFCSFYKVDFIPDFFEDWIEVVDSTIGRTSKGYW
jgi:hypothetical protein